MSERGMIGPEAMGPGMAQAAAANKEAKDAAAARIETLKILDKDDLKLGDLNPLIHRPDLTRKESVDAVRHIALQKIRENNGLMPETLESAVVIDLKKPEERELRFIARFDVPSLTEGQLVLLEELVGQTYSMAVRTRRDSKGNVVEPESYPPTQFGEELKSRTGGWYMGPGEIPTISLHQGLYVFKDLGKINEDNFFSNDETPGKYIVEIRDASLHQTDLVAFVTQVASVLGQEKLLDKGQLLYESYYDLMRLGLKSVEAESIYGMDEAIGMIRRELITPLASPDITKGIGEDPQSVLMIGVPGTGKTLIAERLLQEDTGIFILPIDPFELQKELILPAEKQTLMPRIAQVSRTTGRQVVLHIDDIENMVGENENTNSTLLNLMAGVQERGFYVMASSNYPEKINPSLIQPQRFSLLLHCGLQDEKARFEILKIHADMESIKLGKPLFSSDEVRDIILGAVAENTDAFTPRYLANIATIAKSHLVERVAQAKETIVGLTEDDLEGYNYEVEDWEKALSEVSSKYNRADVKSRDNDLRKFVQKHSQSTVGFAVHEISPKKIFSPEISEKILAAEAQLKQNP